MALPARVRRGYAMGSVATGTFGTVPGLLLLPYLTDTLGVAAVVAGLIVFVPKAWDVVLNPIAGRISDRSRSPRGRRGPFLLRAGVALAVAFALIFAGPSAPPAFAAWVLVAFLLCATAYAFFQVPFNAMPAEITSDAGERTRMMTWRVAVIAIAILLSGATAPLVVGALALWTVTSDVAWPAYVAAGIAGIGYAGTQVCPLAMLPESPRPRPARPASTASACSPASGRPGRHSGSRSALACTDWCWPRAVTPSRPAGRGSPRPRSPRSRSGSRSSLRC